VQPDDWTDSEDEGNSNANPSRRIQTLEHKLAQVQQDFVECRKLISQKLDIKSLIESQNDPGPSSAAPSRDDDTHYFDSYAENGMGFLKLFPHQEQFLMNRS
jgi:type I protein arginine methyltransferase